MFIYNYLLVHVPHHMLLMSCHSHPNRYIIFGKGKKMKSGKKEPFSKALWVSRIRNVWLLPLIWNVSDVVNNLIHHCDLWDGSALLRRLPTEVTQHGVDTDYFLSVQTNPLAYINHQDGTCCISPGVADTGTLLDETPCNRFLGNTRL